MTSEHRLGFGCANLYGLPGKRDRRAVLEAAYDFGVRHFDVAPIYGLGLAEAEVAEFARNRGDITIATKFGLRPTGIGLAAGFVQPPVRRLMQKSASVKSTVKQSEGGGLDRILYSRKNFSVENVKRALASSLRALRTDRIDYFLLHEPTDEHSEDYPALVDYLESECRRGTVANWGPAGGAPGVHELDMLTKSASVVQISGDLFAGYGVPAPGSGSTVITHGFLSTALPRVQAELDRDPELRVLCSEMLGADLSEERNVVMLLVGEALDRNEGGIVLFSSTKTHHVELICRAAADTALRNVSEVATKIRESALTTVAKR
jgi:D-threo-aldose 1-dehydrogenase